MALLCSNGEEMAARNCQRAEEEGVTCLREKRMSFGKKEGI